MTPGSAYDAIVASVEAIVVTQTHERDRFNAHAGTLAEMPVRDRVFLLSFQTGVDRIETRMGCDEYHAEFEMTTVYTSSNKIQQRMGDDTKLVYDALVDLIGSSDITDVQFLSSDISMADDRTYFSRRNFDVTFIAT